MFSKKATKVDKISTIDLTFTKYILKRQSNFVNFYGLLRKDELYDIVRIDIGIF